MTGGTGRLSPVSARSGVAGHVAALLVPVWLPPALTVAALQHANLVSWLVEVKHPSAAADFAFTAVLTLPLVSAVLLLLALPTSLQVVWPSLLVGVPVYIGFVRQGWIRLWHFILAAGVLGGLLPGLWQILYGESLPPLFPSDRLTATFLGGLLGMLVGLVMWLQAGLGANLGRSRLLGGLLVVMLVPPALPAMLALLLARLLGLVDPAARLALTLALAVVLPALWLGPGLFTAPTFAGPVVAIALWSAGTCLIVSLWRSPRRASSAPAS